MTDALGSRRFAASKRYSDGNRPRTDRQGHGQRIEAIRRPNMLLRGACGAMVLLVVLAGEQFPAHTGDDKPARDADDREREAEEREDVRPNQERAKQKQEAVHGHAPGELVPFFVSTLAGQGQEDRRIAEWVDDRKEDSKDKEEGVHELSHHPLQVCISSSTEGSPTGEAQPHQGNTGVYS